MTNDKEAPAIEIKGLTKSFKGHLSIGRFQALDGVDLVVPGGVIYGFLGPNGAGKTTTLKILTGMLSPDEGRIRIFGEKAYGTAVASRIGFLPEAPYFYEYLTGRELLMFFGRLFGLPRKLLKERASYLLDRVGLTEKAGLQLRKYSKGMLQRIGLAQAMLNDPDLVILDEPMSALDPIGRREVRDVILDMKRDGKTVFFSSHILADAEMICDEVAILVKGKVVEHGSLDVLLERDVHFWDVSVKGWKPPAKLGDAVVVNRKNNVLLRIEREKAVQEVIDMAREAGGQILGVTPHKASLEDLFMERIPEG
jgi:ABC-2 type transport system ATP-binding protein